MCDRLRLLLPLLPALLAAAAHAADDAKPPPPPPPVQADGDSHWTRSGRVGAFYNSVATEDAATSRDGSIAGSNDSTSWLLSFDATALWRAGDRSSDQNLRLRYGKIRQQGQPWVENTDEIHYDGVVREQFARPHFVYASWGGDSVFTSPVDRKPLNPLTAHVGAGYGQLYEGLLFHGDGDAKKPEQGRDRLELRLGARAQKRWSRYEEPSQGRVETGIEGFARYDRPVDGALRWFVQYEIFSEFNDLSHITQLVTAGLTAQLSKYLTAELGFRAYRESHPKEIPARTPGYDLWGMRQDTLVGLTYSF